MPNDAVHIRDRLRECMRKKRARPELPVSQRRATVSPWARRPGRTGRTVARDDPARECRASTNPAGSLMAKEDRETGPRHFGRPAGNRRSCSALMHREISRARNSPCISLSLSSSADEDQEGAGSLRGWRNHADPVRRPWSEEGQVHFGSSELTLKADTNLR